MAEQKNSLMGITSLIEWLFGADAAAAPDATTGQPRQCSISPCYCNEKINTPRRQIIGAAISLAMPDPNGVHEHADH
jgi:hypothetical protein